MKKRRFAVAIAKQIFAVALSLTIIMPFVIILINSLKTRTGALLMDLSLPKVPVWQNYQVVVERGKLFISFFNSLLYATVSTLGTVVLTALAAYVMSRRRTRLTRFLYSFIVFGIMLPTNFVALIKVMQLFGLINTRVGIIAFYIASNTAFATFIIYGFVSSIPRAMDESAAIDGAKPLRLFFSIIFPLLQPVLVTTAVLTFLGIWNDFITPLYLLNRSTAWPMTLSIYSFFGRFQQDWNLVFADIVLTCVPVMAIYLVGQRYIVQGMTAGAVKG
jgi:raffinose/stachyose/melibiose transport system permease protein